MTRPAQSIVYFGVYVVLLGATLILTPNVLLGVFGFPITSEVWIRVLGIVAVVLGAYYIVMGRQDVVAFFRATVIGRIWVFLALSALVIIGLGRPPLVLFGALELLGAVWTWRSLRQSSPVIPR